MAFTPKKRPKPDSKNPKIKPNSSDYSSSSSSLRSLLMEPSPNFFPSKGDFIRLLAVVTIAASVTMTCNYLVTFLNRQPKPYCDSNTDFDFSLSDICEPCPSNGECFEGKLKCAGGYRKLGKLCVEDGDINETAAKIAKLVENRLCEAYAQYLCYGTGIVWVQEDKLWDIIDEFNLMDNYGSDNTIYTHAKQRSMVNVAKSLDTRTKINGFKEVKCPDLLVKHYKPVTCCIRQWIADHALALVLVSALLAGCTWLALKIHRKYYLMVRAEELYNKVCDILEEHALISKSGNGEGEPWVVASWLRDYILLPKERKDPLLWKKVEELVQEDSRLNRYPKLVKGESKVVWEWQVEGSLSSSGKRMKGRESKVKLNEDKNSPSNQQTQPPRTGEPLKY